MRQNLFAHGPGAMTSCSPTSIRPWSVSTAVTASSGPSSSPVTSTPVRISTPSAAGLRGEPVDGVLVEREAALGLVQAGGDALRAPVGEELLHVRGRPRPRR